jgi:branched-chain amino acid transport system ATP-binding protein
MLTLNSLALSYGGVHAVRDVSLDVAAGTRLALIGPNGAGKTSLLALLGGQARPSSGTITLAGQDITRARPHRRAHLGVARSFQIASLFPELTVREQVALALLEPSRLGWVGVSGRSPDGAVDRMLEDWGFAREAWQRRPGELSYGRQRTLELALALARRPKLLLLDEPNVGLTAGENAALVDRIRAFDRSMTVILVAHDMDVVFGVADRVVVMQHGRIVVDGSPEAVRNDPLVADIYFGKAEAS